MKNWKYINGAEVGNEAKVNPVDPSPKTGSKPNPDNNQNPKKNQKKEMTDKNGRTFREVLEEVKKTGNKYNIKPMSYKADAYRYGKELAEKDFKNFKYSNTSTLETIYRNNTSGEDYEQYGFLDFKKGYYDTYQQMDKKVGNSTEKLFYSLKDDAEKEEKKSDEALDELKKTENRIIEKESEMGQELKNLLKKAPEWIKEKIQFAFSHGFTIDEKDYINAIKKEVGNSRTGNYKTGTSKLKPGDKVESYGVKGVVKSIKGENEDNIYGEPLIEVEFNSGVKKVVPEHYLIKVGNKAGNSTYTESDRKRLYELARKHNKTAQEWAEFDELNRKEEKASEELIKRIGKNKTGNSAYEDGAKRVGNSDKWHSYDEMINKAKRDLEVIKQKEREATSVAKKQELASARREIEDKIKYYQNHIGNSTSDEYNAEIQRLTRKAEQLRRMGQGKQAMEVEKQIEKLGKELHEYTKTGNSASDDKFAYVMREFEEGKLKTPDGKVVTDPAQAKAIAYSESKKTENGLARARNAMNKKCGNSQITLWKGNNSALVSDDGLVQYLENNSFETDRDKYDSQQTAIEELKKLGYRKK